MKKYINIIIGVILLLSICLNVRFCRSAGSDPITINIHDTITITKDSIITKTLYKTKYDTIIEHHYKDTIIYDTVQIPIEHNISEFTINNDSLTINQKIHHSGFMSTIDSIEMSYNFNYSVEKPKPKKFGWCVTVGPSVSYGVNFNTSSKTFDYGPSLGVSVVIGPSFIIK